MPTNGKLIVRTIGADEAAAEAAAAGGVEVGEGVALVAEGTGVVMKGIGVGTTDVPVVDTHAVKKVVSTAAINSRRTQVATGWRYA
jgi:hypothetical protein